jgi:hypothetical protein
MRIFSSFDTGLRQRTLEEYQQMYGIDNVLCFWRSQLYKIYKVILPLIGLSLFTVLGLMFFYQRLNGSYFDYIVIAIIIMDLVFLFPIIGKYVDYKMDFIIVIPPSIMMYDQWGIFKKNVHTITAQSIKSVKINKSWFFYSIFNNGDIVVLTEWDAEHDGEIRFRWIPKPEKRKDQILKIAEIGIQSNQDSID